MGPKWAYGMPDASASRVQGMVKLIWPPGPRKSKVATMKAEKPRWAKLSRNWAKTELSRNWEN